MGDAVEHQGDGYLGGEDVGAFRPLGRQAGFAEDAHRVPGQRGQRGLCAGPCGVAAAVVFLVAVALTFAIGGSALAGRLRRHEGGSGAGELRRPAATLLGHAHPAGAGRAADHRVAHEAELAHEHAGALPQPLAQAGQRDGFAALALFGQGLQQIPGQRREHGRSRCGPGAHAAALSASATWAAATWGCRITGMDLDVGVPAASATAESGTSGLVSG